MELNINGEPVKQRRGFALLDAKLRRRYCRRGGKSTAKRYGKAHMSRIGRRGRLKRARDERAAKKAVALNPAPLLFPVSSS